MKRRIDITMALFLGSLVLVGAGCAGKGQVAVPAGDANGEAAIGGHPINLNGAPPISVDEDTGQATSIMPSTDTQGSVSASVSTDKAEPTEAGDGTEGADPAKKWPRPTSFPGVLAAAEITGKQARIVTPKGTIVIELLGKEAPKTVSNFVALARSGFYDGLTFHRFVSGFVIQGGDPSGNGTGGPGYKFEDEPVTREYATGSVAMANAGPDTNGSQFFIVLTEEGASNLGKLYNNFGVVTSGMDVVLSLRQGDTMTSVTIEDKK